MYRVILTIKKGINIYQLLLICTLWFLNLFFSQSQAEPLEDKMTLVRLVSEKVNSFFTSISLSFYMFCSS